MLQLVGNHFISAWTRATACSTLLSKPWGQPFLSTKFLSTSGLPHADTFRWASDRRIAQEGRLPENLPMPLDHVVKQIGPEFAFIGQSNAGKSSMVNLLTGNPNLAKVSKKPGRTRTINHFLINRKWMLVDCPGYGGSPGYEVSKQDRMAWHELTKEYFLSRRTLAHIFLLIDASTPLAQDDIHAAMWINDSGRPWSLVFTKLDVVQTGQPHPVDRMEDCVEQLERLTATLLPFIPTSSSTGLGKDVLLKYISSLRQGFKMPLVFK